MRLILVVVTALACQARAAEPPQWMWSTARRQAGQNVVLFSEFEVNGPLRQATLHAATECCRAAVFLNGEAVELQWSNESLAHLEVTARLRPGGNVLGVNCQGIESASAIAAQLDLVYEDGTRQTLVSDGGWSAAEMEGDFKSWPKQPIAAAGSAATLGAVEWDLTRDPADAVAVELTDDYEQWRRATSGDAGADPATFQTPPGFEVTLLRSAAADEDSWVSLACDERGRWIIAKEKKGLLRITLPAGDGGETRVETINDDLAECRGLLFAHGALYAMANNDKTLVCLRDTDGDDRYDELTQLQEFKGDVGHGRNQITLGPDGRIYAIFGDSVFEPDDARRLPPLLAEPNRFEQARSGFVASCNADGQDWVVLTRGLRNPFGIAFNAAGEAFSYDADAEFDMGTSWYRPTRIVHLVPGGDFGWREVTGQWPPYFPDRADMPPPTVDIGKGSPTAVAFGGAGFTPPYCDALFVLDWAYGRILAVHLVPRGGGYAARPETFLRGRPLNVTDVEFGPDGAMYFVTGGRGTQSALYRVAFTGAIAPAPPSTLQQQARNDLATAARSLRRELESRLGQPSAGALEAAWPHLAHVDPAIRHAARCVVETQPLETWRDMALSEEALTEESPDRMLAALTALVHTGNPRDLRSALAHLLKFPTAGYSERAKLEALFVIERCLEAFDVIDDELRAAALTRLDALYPDASPRVNQRLSLLLSASPPPRFVDRTLKLLAGTSQQAEQFHYLFVLRGVTEGWSDASRRAYFQALAEMEDFVGGEGLPAFKQRIREEALAAAPAQQRGELEKLLAAASASDWLTDLPAEPRPVIREWKLEDLTDLPEQLARRPDLERGEKMFAAARCIVCHRSGGRGGVSGPDLTSLAARFSPRDALVSIVDPSKVIDEKYQNVSLALKDGRIVVGRVVPGDYRSSDIKLVPNLLEADKTVTVSKHEVAQHQPSPVSPMPSGLLNTLSQEEIRDLLAYLMSGGKR